MLKKVLVALVCLLVTTALWSWAATAWQLQTKVVTVGGSIKVRNLAAQTGAGSIAYTNLTTGADVPVTVASNPGYAISALTKNGAAVALGTYTSNYTTTYNKLNGSPQSLLASFAVKKVLVTGTVSGPGSITPTSYSVNYNGSVNLVATPTTTANTVTGVTVNGVPYPANYPVTGSLTIALTNVTAPTTVSATFSSVTVNAGSPQVVIKNTPVTLNGSMTGGGNPVWTQVSGPAGLSQTSWTTLTPSLTPTVSGLYTFQLAAVIGTTTLATATTQVNVIESTVTASMRTSCNGCHGPTGLSPSPAFVVWSSSIHKALDVNCVTCHTISAPMPTPVNTSSVDARTFLITGSSAGTVGNYFCMNCHLPSVATDFQSSLHNTKAGMVCSSCHTQGPHSTNPPANICASCHADAQGNVALHPVTIPPFAVCISCHNQHSGSASGSTGMPAAHFNNLTGANYPASYNTSRSTCADCHFNDAATTNLNASHRHDWAQSGHGAVTDSPWTAYDFKTRSGCVQCHTTTGFIAYSTGKVTAAWGVASDKTKEVLTCIGCHSDVTNGTVRNVTPVKPFADDAYVNRNVGKSNICFDCHSGRNNGNSIAVQVGVADFTNTPFVAPHYLAAAANLHGKSGYHFPGQAYAFYSSNTHRQIGMNNQFNTGTAGPCVACHMSGPGKHLYKSVTTDANGVITGLNSPLCVNCHAAYLTAPKLEASHAGFANALNVLKAMLAAKGFVYTANYPYFANTNWGSGQNGANIMGAAYNYKMLLADPGAFAHNAAYTRKLINDSIDAVYNGGTVTGSIDSAISYLVSTGAITQAVADSMTSFKGTTACTTCHGGTAATAGTMATNGHPSHLTSSYGPAPYLGKDVSSCTACHVYGAATHMNGTTDLAPASCLGCHPGGAPLWNSTARIDCTVCHAATASVLPNGVAAPFKANFATTGHGIYSGSNQCVSCHDANSPHISGTLGSYTRLTLSDNNDLCASCHNNPAVVGVARLNMPTHETVDCRTCHDPHGTTNLSMIRTVINNTTITYTDRVNGLVDPVTNLGFCQVCHTKTNHYRAGVPEPVVGGHYTSGCFACHTHKAAGGAFTAPMSKCDSCHGYPPVPAGTSFGTLGNFSSARTEDYLGGGGAHVQHVSKNARASEGWTNCEKCHSHGSLSPSTHTMILPVTPSKVTIDLNDKYRFNPNLHTGPSWYSGVLVDGGANTTGSCSNVNCHFKPSKSWSAAK